ncbi:alpha-ketoglutarate-dependent dioxygenase AlkB [Streptomyces cinereospinus]
MDGMDAELFPRDRTEIAPGAVHVPDWLDGDGQRELLRACRGVGTAARRAAHGPHSGRRHHDRPAGLPGLALVPVRLRPYGRRRRRRPGEALPGLARRTGRRAVTDALGAEAASGAPFDIALINFYGADARMGMHRDGDEKSHAPVVSLSLGDSCVFRFGNTGTRARPYTDVELRSGDLFVFGGPSRLAYHGVPRVLPGTAPRRLGLTGRLNVTLRVSGFRAGEPPDERIMGDSPS